MENKKLDKLRDEGANAEDYYGPIYVDNHDANEVRAFTNGSNKMREAHAEIVEASIKLLKVLKLAYGHHYPAGLTELRDLEKTITEAGYLTGGDDNENK